MTFSLGHIPKGVLLCLKNSDRHREDARILAEKDKYPSAIVSLFISIEEFSKALWLAGYLIKTKDIEHDEDGNKIFGSHRPKLDFFFDYVDKIEGYERATGKNEWVKLSEIISDEQDYKLRMLYVDYDGNRDYDKRRGKAVWWDPNNIVQLMWVGDYNTNFSLKTKYDELNKDLEFAISYFRKSPLYNVIMKVQPPKTPHAAEIITYLNNHFVLAKGHVQITAGVEKKTIRVDLGIRKTQTWINENLTMTIKNEFEKIYPSYTANVKVFLK